MGKKMMAYERISIFKDCRLEFFFLSRFFLNVADLAVVELPHKIISWKLFLIYTGVSRFVNIVIYGPFFSITNFKQQEQPNSCVNTQRTHLDAQA